MKVIVSGFFVPPQRGHWDGEFVGIITGVSIVLFQMTIDFGAMLNPVNFYDAVVW